MAYSHQIREEELKNLIARDLFSDYDTAHIIGNVDFAVAAPSDNNSSAETEYLLWAEAKKGTATSIENSFVQLILTIGKARTFESYMPPKFIGAFDAEKIAFIPYESIQEVFYKNDFNWNITPSDHTTKEFRTVLDLVSEALSRDIYSFKYDAEKKELARFIKANFCIGKRKISKIRISKNNFVVIYQKWLNEVKPTIMVDWEAAKGHGVLDSDFYLADLLSKDNSSIMDRLQVLLKKTHYELARRRNEMGLFTSSSADFTDGQKAHKKFWNRYDRPPKKEYWDYIINRKDLLVPQDIRERQGSFFTPQKWVELSQQYLEQELGENWQDEYYIWDCAAGTGNLLNGLTNKYNIYASTLNQADVDAIHERIENGANLLHDHVFQFDFLNDPFDRLPPRLREIIDNEDLRKKLVIYINPPYAEAATTRQKTGTGKNKPTVAKNRISQKYKVSLGSAVNEIYAQFMIRVYHEIPSSVLANFSTLKNLQAPNFRDFRASFRAKLGRIFLMPASSFDNVNGSFPIGFFIWHLQYAEAFRFIKADIYDKNGEYAGQKLLTAPDPQRLLMDWLKTIYDKTGKRIAYLRMLGSDIQNNNGVFITNTPSESDLKQRKTCDITASNLIGICVYCAIRHVIASSWLNDRDQYTFPSPDWSADGLFQTDCLVYTLFYGQNRINQSGNSNHWIPFTEEEVGARDCFKSHFMTDFISGKARHAKEADLFSETDNNNTPLEFSEEATNVFEAGRELWRYYHSQPDSNPDASLYDIRLHFQGTKTTKNGKIQMKTDSDDATYTRLIQNLRDRLKTLAAKIEPKVYEYGFLKKIIV